MKYTVSFFKRKIKAINDGLEKENYIHRLRGQFEMEKGQLKKVAFYYCSVHVFKVLNKQAILTDGLPPKKAEQWLDDFEPKKNGLEISQSERFVNGFDSWNATHFELVRCLDTSKPFSHSNIRFACQGREGMYELAREMTDKFEDEHKGVFWDGGLPLALKGSVRRTTSDKKAVHDRAAFFWRDSTINCSGLTSAGVLRTCCSASALRFFSAACYGYSRWSPEGRHACSFP